MKIRMTRDWRRNRAGDVVDYFPNVADLLIRRGLAELETATVSPVECAAQRIGKPAPRRTRRAKKG